MIVAVGSVVPRRLVVDKPDDIQSTVAPDREGRRDAAARRLGGDVAVRCRLGKGSTTMVTLPAAFTPKARAA